MAYQAHSFMFQHHEEDRHHHHSHHIATNPNNNNSNLFHGGGGHETAVMMMKRSLSFEERGGGGGGGDQDDMSDDGSQGMMGEMKKKRLSLEQVKTLEKSFEIGNKLEPERKLQLANALGLQPRQVAIWFQNRRARWKTKQLEKDYDVLRKQFDLVKADNDSLHAQNKKLHAQLSALKGRDSSEANQKKDHQQGDQGSWSNNGSDQNSSDNNNTNLDISRATHQVMNNNNNTTTTTTASSASSQLINGKNLFPANLRPSSITQLLQSSTTTRSNDHPILQSDENFCNMLVNGAAAAAGAEADHHHQGATGFWPWTEQHYFH